MEISNEHTDGQTALFLPLGWLLDAFNAVIRVIFLPLNMILWIFDSPNRAGSLYIGW